MADAMRSDTLGPRDPSVTDLVIRDKADAKIVAPHSDSAEVVMADKVDRRFDGVHPQRAASLKRAPKRIEKRSEFRVLSAKMVVDTIDPAGVCLSRLCKLPATARARPQRLGSRIRALGHRSPARAPFTCSDFQPE